MGFTVTYFWPNFPSLHPLKTRENLWFSVVLRGYKMETLARNGLKTICVLTLDLVYKGFHDKKIASRES